MKKLDRARLILHKETKKKRDPAGSFLAIHLLNDPQVNTLYQDLYGHYTTYNEPCSIFIFYICVNRNGKTINIKVGLK